MNWQRITAWFILAVTVIIIAFDCVAYYKGGVQSTISTFFYQEAFKVPAIPFAFGCLMGHFFLS